MKTLYLHIGTPKTATTSLQKFLDLNQEVLRSQNYSYRIFPFSFPGVGKRRNGHFLADMEQDELSAEEGARKYQERVKTGLDFMKEQFESYDNVILSDEHLWYSIHYSQRDPLQILLDHAKANDYQIRIIVYLRRQDKFEISRWNLHARSRRSSRTLLAHIQNDLNAHPLILFYDQALDKIAERIGKENLSVRRFEPSSWPQGSIYCDFQKALQLPDDISLEYPENNFNVGLKKNYIDLQIEVNNSVYLSDEQKDQLTKYIIQASGSREEHDEYGFLSADESRQFLSLFEEGNARVAEEYLKDGKPLFSDPIQEVKKWTPENEYMLDDFRFFLSSMTKKTRELYKSAEILDSRLRDRNLQEQNSSLETTVGDLQEQISSLENKISDLQAQNSTLKTKISDLQVQNRSQEYTLQKLRKFSHPIRTLTEKITGKPKEKK